MISGRRNWHASIRRKYMWSQGSASPCHNLLYKFDFIFHVHEICPRSYPLKTLFQLHWALFMHQDLLLTAGSVTGADQKIEPFLTLGSLSCRFQKDRDCLHRRKATQGLDSPYSASQPFMILSLLQVVVKLPQKKWRKDSVSWIKALQ